jgi:rhamnulokinase
MDYLAIDLGAGSGRAIVGSVEDGKIRLDEIHRFPNTPVKLGDTLYWDFLSLFDNLKQGIRKAVQKGYKLSGIAVDTWGVDFGLLDKNGRLLSNPVCYRDSMNGDRQRFSALSDERFYEITGIQQMEINTVYRLQKDKTGLVSTHACKMLFIPDLLNYFLTGVMHSEYTIASTSQMLDAVGQNWSGEIFDKLHIDSNLASDIIQPCTLTGYLTEEIAAETGAGKIPVFAVGSHDTASAIASIAAEGSEWAFLSSGTWSLLGVTLDKPVLTDEARLHHFTNEGGVDNKILFMRNLTGLWLLQQLFAEWEKEGEECSFDYLLSECAKAESFQSVVDGDDPVFSHPSSMRQAIRERCRETRQQVPETQGELARCVLLSLAEKYAIVLDELKTCTRKSINKLHIVGGGSRNGVFNQLISNRLHVEVSTGLAEATAVGNIVQQAIANRQIANLEEGHQIIKNSFNITRCFPV